MGKSAALSILTQYCDPAGAPYLALVAHGDAIWAKIRGILERQNIEDADANLLEEAAYLHDIGAIRTHAPKIGCAGEAPYLMHGLFGRDILDAEGLPRHALIAERHIGVGLTRADIEGQGLPLPKRDALPVTLEEELLCFADLFFSKTPGKEGRERSAARIREKLARHGERQVRVFDGWCVRFGEPLTHQSA